jgi:hypothetical protein
MSKLIFNNLLEKVGTASENLNDYLNDNKLYNNNIYDILYNLPKNLIVFYILIALLIYFIIKQLNIKLNEILTFLICSIVIYFLIQKDYSSFTKFTKMKNEQLLFLNKIMMNKTYKIENNINNNILDSNIVKDKSYLYLDPLIIDFFYDVRECAKYNISSYTNALKHSNILLGIEYESNIGINRKYYNYEMAVEQSKKALNEFQALIYSIPSTIISYNKFEGSLKILHQILNAHLIKMNQLFQNLTDIENITIDTYPDNFYDMNFFISADDTKTKNYISTYNMF